MLLIMRALVGLVVALAIPATLAAAEAAAEGGHEVVVPPTVWAIASFLIVLTVLWRKVLPQINVALDKRAAEIRSSLAAAAQAKADAEAAMSKHHADLELARQEARAIIDEGKSDAERLKSHIVAEARREAEELLARSRREIDLAKGAAIEDLHRRSVALSFDLASRLIQKTLRSDEHQELVLERIRSFEAGGS